MTKIAVIVAMVIALFSNVAYAEPISCHMTGYRDGHRIDIDLSRVTCDFSTSSPKYNLRQSSPIAPSVYLPRSSSPSRGNSSVSNVQPARVVHREPPGDASYANLVELGRWTIESGQSLASVLGSNTEAKRAMDDMGIEYTSNDRYSLIPLKAIPPGFTFSRSSVIYNGVQYIWYERVAY